MAAAAAAAAAAAGQCARLHRQLSSLLAGLGSARLELESEEALRDSCDALALEVKELRTLEGSAQELAALRR